MLKKKICYIAEINIPSKSAYSIHVMKMCEAFAKLKYDVNLYIINHQNYKKININYNINNKFRIHSIFNKAIQLNLFYRIIFSLKILFKYRKTRMLFVSRSIIFSLLASITHVNVILELHHEISGFSKIIYFIFKKLNLIKNLKYIFLNKNLNKIYKISKKNFLILDDAVNINNFKVKKSMKYKKTCVYIGSFFEGKGVEQLFRLAKINKDINFHIYGEKKFLNEKIKTNNIKIFDHITYNKVPKILSKYEIALMPYQKKVKGRSSINLERYMSPLKMFDYLAAKMIILASDLKVYKHILKDHFNCILIKVNDDKTWSNTINKLIENKIDKSKLKKNAYKTAINNTWEKRCIKIINFFNKEKKTDYCNNVYGKN
ncbi:glycosyltransferase [Candidatus Pelagibacter sp.]|nr:glycosyltransferase [Candidatus Pelagibacter sp.]